MFDLRKKGPTRPFSHADHCKLVKADPRVEIPWTEIESGHWQAVCQCGSENFYEEPADRRARLDPLDPSTFRHAGGCEHRDTSDPALLRAILKVQDGAGGDYWWVKCGTCDTAWQVPTTPRTAWGDDEPAGAQRSGVRLYRTREVGAGAVLSITREGASIRVVVPTRFRSRLASRPPRSGGALELPRPDHPRGSARRCSCHLATRQMPS
jgi:hypothetical protein